MERLCSILRTCLAEGRSSPASIADEVEAVALILIASFFVEAVTLTVTRDVEEAGRAVVWVSFEEIERVLGESTCL